MADLATVFSLRLRDPRLRALVQEAARREGVSQNVLIERALQEDMVVRGRLMASDLSEAAERLSVLTDEAYGRVVARSMEGFAQGEARKDPLAASALASPTGAGSGAPEDRADARATDPLGVLTAFHAAHR